MVKPDETCYRYVLETAARRPLLPLLGPLVDDTLKSMRLNFMAPDSECFSAVDSWRRGSGVSLDSERGTTQTKVKVPKS